LKDKSYYCWVLVAGLFVFGTTIVGVRSSFGVFFKSIESAFDLTRTTTATFHSLMSLLAGLFAFLTGWLLDKYGPRVVVLLMGMITGLSLVLTSQTNSSWQLFITYSLLLSIGVGGSYVVVTSVVLRWFRERRGLALGIAGSGSQLGIVIMAPFATYLISNFDWRMAYLIIGAIVWLVIIPISRLFIGDTRKVPITPDDVIPPLESVQNVEETVLPTGLSLMRASKTTSFWIIMLMRMSVAICLSLIFTHLVPHATDIGISAIQAATVISVFGVSGIPGRVIAGFVSDRIGIKLSVTICLFLQVGALLWLIWLRELWMFYLLAVVLGLGNGGLSFLMGLIVGDTFGLRQIGTILGAMSIGFGVGAAVGPTIGGFIFDVYNSYSAAFLIVAVFQFLVALLVPVIKRETGKVYQE
ncbi:MFS transporter, partial [Chloroflexota bacterium]